MSLFLLSSTSRTISVPVVALAVPDAKTVLPIVNGFMRGFHRVILIQDWHPPGHVCFASSHPGHSAFSRITLPHGDQVLWPEHGVAGTDGAAFHPGLHIPAGATVVRKGIHADSDSYSAFFENDRETPVGLDDILRRSGAGDIVLAGLARDYCVLQAPWRRWVHVPVAGPRPASQTSGHGTPHAAVTPDGQHAAG